MPKWYLAVIAGGVPPTTPHCYFHCLEKCGMLSQVKAEKPKWYLAVIAGGVLRTQGHVSSRAADFLGYLTKGQLPPTHISLTRFQEALVLDGALLLHLCSYLLFLFPFGILPGLCAERVAAADAHPADALPGAGAGW